MTENASQFVGDIPENYDERLGPVIFEDYASDIAERAAGLKPYRVLELAAGTGIVSRKLRDRLPTKASLVVTDLNQPMLEVARKKFKAGENIKFAVADAMKLNYPDTHFDLVVCQFGVMFFPDKQASFREVLRVLKPGGTYLFNVWGSWAENPCMKVAHDTAAKYFPTDPPGFYRVPFSYPDPEVVTADISAAGFPSCPVTPMPIEKKVTDWNAFAHGIVYGNPLRDEILSRGGVDPDDVVSSIARAFRENFSEEPTTMPLKATIYAAQKKQNFASGLFKHLMRPKLERSIRSV